jgi:hypothetical protein
MIKQRQVWELNSSSRRVVKPVFALIFFAPLLQGQQLAICASLEHTTAQLVFVLDAGHLF